MAESRGSSATYVTPCQSYHMPSVGGRGGPGPPRALLFTYVRYLSPHHALLITPHEQLTN